MSNNTIIYPPYIKETIPAFIKSKIEIPFTNNPAINLHENKDSDKDDVTGFVLKVIEYISGNTVETLISNIWEYDTKRKSGIVYFTPESTAYTKGQYYKFQLAYTNQNNIDSCEGQQYAYSVASAGRCLGDNGPEITIRNGGKTDKPPLSINSINLNITEFTGRYKTTILSEPIYKYRFIFRDKDTQAIIEDTEWVLHNVDKDIVNTVNKERITEHVYKLKSELNKWTQYEIVYQIQTVNEFIKEIACPIIQVGAPPTLFQGTVEAYQDQYAKENGYIAIDIKATPDKLIRGSFELLRTTNHKRWDLLTTFDLTKMSDITRYTWKDWSVEQGIPYTYAIRQNSNGIVSEKIESAPVVIEFDHIFLSDADRQLKLAFNPNVSSIKDIVQESKVETLGSQYPFFFKNATVKYREFPISGLLSYLMDDDETFITNEELNLVDPVRDANNERIPQNRPRTTNLTHYNFGSERIFKFEVLEWLNNGKPKLFRSPAEGNYIVRLMNASLSPNAQVGRMLHTFSSTGYEIMEHNVENLQKEKILDLKHIEDEPYGSIIKTVNCYQVGANNVVAEMSNGSIENVIWQVTIPNTSDYIKLDGEKFYNNHNGIIQTPPGVKYSKIELGSLTDENRYGGVITYTCTPEFDDTVLGIDDYANMVGKSEYLLTTIPTSDPMSYNLNKQYEYNIIRSTNKAIDSVTKQEVDFNFLSLDNVANCWLAGKRIYRTPQNPITDGKVDGAYRQAIATKHIFKREESKEYNISYKLPQNYSLIIRRYNKSGDTYGQVRTDKFFGTGFIKDFFTKIGAKHKGQYFALELQYEGSLLTSHIDDLKTKLKNGDLSIAISEKTLTLYKVYGLVAHAEDVVEGVPPQIIFKSLSDGAQDIIYLNDGQPRYFYDLPSDLVFEKSQGVHLTLYAFGYVN